MFYFVSLFLLSAFSWIIYLFLVFHDNSAIALKLLLLVFSAVLWNLILIFNYLGGAAPMQVPPGPLGREGQHEIPAAGGPSGSYLPVSLLRMALVCIDLGFTLGSTADCPSDRLPGNWWLSLHPGWITENGWNWGTVCRASQIPEVMVALSTAKFSGAESMTLLWQDPLLWPEARWPARRTGSPVPSSAFRWPPSSWCGTL